MISRGAVSDILSAGVYAYGFERPSAIQQRAIMPVIKGELQSRPKVSYKL